MASLAARQKPVTSPHASRYNRGRLSALLLRAHSKPTSSEARTAPCTSRDVVAAASSASFAFLPAPQNAPAGSWLEAVLRLAFPQNATRVTEEDVEWVKEFGQFLDPAEELGHRHSMYVSHLAERLAVEPPATQR